MADEDISLTEDQLLDNLDESNNGEAEFLNEVGKRICQQYLLCVFFSILLVLR